MIPKDTLSFRTNYHSQAQSMGERLTLAWFTRLNCFNQRDHLRNFISNANQIVSTLMADGRQTLESDKNQTKERGGQDIFHFFFTVANRENNANK